MLTLPQLRGPQVIGLDTETTGLSPRHRPVGLSFATPAGSGYLSWGAGDPDGATGPALMNNCDLATAKAWVEAEVDQAGNDIVFHNATFDLRMLAYHGIFFKRARLHDTQGMAVLLNEHRPHLSLDGLGEELGLGRKADGPLHEWMARHLRDEKGRFLKPARRACAPHYWRVPVGVLTEYAEHDAVLTRRLYEALTPQLGPAGVSAIYAMEMELLPVLLRMHLVGVRVDVERAEVVKRRLTRAHAELEERWRAAWGDRSYSSPDDLREVLDQLGISYPLTPKTRKPQVNKDFLAGLDHPVGAQIRSLRQLRYYRDVVIDSYVLSNLRAGGDRLYPEFHPLKSDKYGTVTGRLSSGGDLNAQNLPARDEVWSPALRGIFVPLEPGATWWRLDYSQIEYRFFAHYAGELARARAKFGRGTGRSAMEEAYLADPLIDFHQWVADTAGIKRKRAKNVNFCRLYGGGIKKIALTAGCSYDEAAEFVAAYDAKIPEAKFLSDDLTSVAQRRGFVRTWAGRYCRFITEGEHAAKYKQDQPRHPGRYAMTYTALNKVLQGSAADLIKRAMIAIDKEIDYETTVMSLTVHDELDGSFIGVDPATEGAKLQTIMQDVARTPSWTGSVMRVPVIADLELGPNWGMQA